ncbi:hypothetical protein O7R04_01220 [Bacillus velezensis]|nr:hypothetical protein [Bacillus velezensis]WBL39575.1 hypothetical protein O7R04_01220 [Bacillus velezensis]
MSGCNSGIFSAGRMLYTLGVNGQAPKFFKKVSSSGVPIFGTLAVLIGLVIGVVLNYIAPPKIFVYVYSASVFAGNDSVVRHFDQPSRFQKSERR